MSAYVCVCACLCDSVPSENFVLLAYLLSQFRPICDHTYHLLFLRYIRFGVAYERTDLQSQHLYIHTYSPYACMLTSYHCVCAMCVCPVCVNTGSIILPFVFFKFEIVKRTPSANHFCIVSERLCECIEQYI